MMKTFNVNNNRSFVEYHKKILASSEFDEFLEALQSPKRVSIRVNTLKTSPQELLRRLQINAIPVPWCTEAFWVDESSTEWIGKTLSHALGYYYIQDASSMIPPLVLQASPGETVLDMCAAPGSKTTQIGQGMYGRGTLIANDIGIRRARTLVASIQKFGLTNVVVTTIDGTQLGRYYQTCDKVLIDAPCSAVGAELKAVNQWNMDTVRRLANLQKKLIVAGFQMLVEGGVLVYSTCTTSIEENEDVVEYLLKKFPDEAVLEEIKVPGLKFVPGFTETTRRAIRVFPHHHNTSSFFVARIRRMAKPRKTEKTTQSQSELARINGDFRVLENSETKAIISYLRERFGYHDLPDFRFLARGRKHQRIYTRVLAFSGSFADLLPIPTEELGLFIGTWEKGEFRPSIEGVEILGEPKRNIVWLKEQEVRTWMKGKDLPMKLKPGCYLIGYEGMFLGGAFSDGRRLINLQPAVFNIEVLK